MTLAARTRNVRIFLSLLQCYVAGNTIQALGVGDGPAVIPAVNDLSWHTALAFALFATYHVAVTEEKALIVSPAVGFVIWATWATTPGVTSDSRATVETIKVLGVNRIVNREYFMVDLWARNELDWVEIVANTGDFIYSCSTTRYLREEMLP
jgi:hypothetical protein